MHVDNLTRNIPQGLPALRSHAESHLLDVINMVYKTLGIDDPTKTLKQTTENLIPRYVSYYIIMKHYGQIPEFNISLGYIGELVAFYIKRPKTFNHATIINGIKQVEGSFKLKDVDSLKIQNTVKIVEEKIKTTPLGGRRITEPLLSPIPTYNMN